MRINQYIALATGLSRRAADRAITDGRVQVNSIVSNTGQQVSDSDEVTLDNKLLRASNKTVTIMLNKPVGYICSRKGQGGHTIYELLPHDLQYLKPVGRLDKDSSGLLLMTNDGQLAHKLTHPGFQKQKVYEVELDKPLDVINKTKIENGVNLDDGLSKLRLNGNGKQWTVTMSEGRNRQIRRTFAALGYKVIKLHRIQFGDYKLNQLFAGKFLQL